MHQRVCITIVMLHFCAFIFDQLHIYTLSNVFLNIQNHHSVKIYICIANPCMSDGRKELSPHWSQSVGLFQFGTKLRLISPKKLWHLQVSLWYSILSHTHFACSVTMPQHCTEYAAFTLPVALCEIPPCLNPVGLCRLMTKRPERAAPSGNVWISIPAQVGRIWSFTTVHSEQSHLSYRHNC